MLASLSILSKFLKFHQQEMVTMCGYKPSTRNGYHVWLQTINKRWLPCVVTKYAVTTVQTAILLLRVCVAF